MDSVPTTNESRTCFGVRLCAELKRLAVLAIVVGLMVIAGKHYCFDRLNEEIRVRVETFLREHYEGLSVTVSSARRIAGQGIEIRGVSIREAGGKTAPVLVDIDEIHADCDTRLPDFLTRPLRVTALHLHRLKLRGERKPSGRWSFSHLLPLPSCQSALAPIARITDASVEIVDPAQTAHGGAGALVLRNIELSVTPQPASDLSGTVLRVQGTLSGDHVQRVEVDGILDPVTSRWELRGAVEGLEFSPRLRAAVPRELNDALAPLSSIRGRTFFGFHVSRPARTAGSDALPPVEFLVHGKISDGRIDDARLPEPLTDVEASIRCDNYSLAINDLSARCGQTQIGLNATIAGYSGSVPIDIELTAHQVQLEQLPIAALPSAVRETWTLFQPRGLVDVAGRVKFDGRQWQPDLKIDCHDLSVCYARFPYRLTDGLGTIFLKPDAVNLDVRLVGGGRFIRCRANTTNPGPRFSGWVELGSEGAVTIDEKLMAAMEAPLARLVQGFHPRGSAAFFARLERKAGETELRRQLTVNLVDCSIQHDRFRYPIDRVCGSIVLDGDMWLFKGLTGRNDSAEITAEGYWGGSQPEARQLMLQFTAKDVPLADELRQALPPASQRLWSSLRPRGNLDQLIVGLHYAAANHQWSIDVRGEKLAQAAGGEGRSLSLEPNWFRYALDNVSGGFHYRDGRMEVTNLRGSHGRATIAAEARGAILPSGGYRLELSNLAAYRVELDQELLSALPSPLGPSLARFPLEGPVNVWGSIGIDMSPRPELPPQVAWSIQLDVENGRLLAPVPIEHIYGGTLLSGRAGEDGVSARGELKIDSAMVRDVQLTALQGPYWTDGTRLVLGALADRESPAGTPRQVTMRVLSGLMSVDGEVRLNSESAFDVQATLANADFAEVARQLAPHQPTSHGKIFGRAHIGGTAQGKHTWHGEGQISLREADLYELPAMVRLLKLLSIQRPDTTAFTNSNIDFRIEGDDLAFDRIDFSGDAISLKGKGRMNGQRQIDLKFYPLVGREERQLAIFRPLVGKTGQEFMLIEVTGTLDHPEIDRRVFPRLDELAQLFPELARDESIESKVPRGVAPREAWNRVLPSRWR